MRRLRCFPVLLLVFCSSACESARDGGRPPSARKPFELEPVDRSVDPCTDFYRFACGPWMAANPLPAERSRHGRFDEVRERNLVVLREILEDAAGSDAAAGEARRQIGDFYAACMDEAKVEAAGAAPITPELELIGAIDSRQRLADTLAHLHAIGVDALFSVRSEPDLLDATQVIGAIDQGGLGLPDRDDYLSEDARTAALRARYIEHVKNMLGLLGETEQSAADDAAAILELETALARVSLTRVERRAPLNVYHRMSLAELEAQSPEIDWRRYLTQVGVPREALEASWNVAVPRFTSEVSALLQAQPLPRIRAYLRWQLVRAYSPYLSSPFVDESFAFYGRTLSGARQQRPRWKRCVGTTDDLLGEALGQPYVERTFGAEGKARTLQMVLAMQRALKDDITGLPWMTEATKDRALEKLDAIANKIGYPERWRDHSAYRVERGDFLGNVARGASFERKRRLDKIGKPVDRTEWEMSPPTVNAYYDPSTNSINFPAGILQPPFYSNEVDDAVNFGAIGAVIGHELTHGFDDQGRLFDARGNLTDWWTAADAAAFDERAACLVDQYSSYTAVDELKLSGRLTLGENIADNGGVRIALMALLDVMGGKKTPAIDGFTQEQRLFLSWGQIWCEHRAPEAARLLAVTDPHAPGQYRVNGVVSNMPEFQRAFHCKEGDPMVRENACRVW